MGGDFSTIAAAAEAKANLCVHSWGRRERCVSSCSLLFWIAQRTACSLAAREASLLSGEPVKRLLEVKRPLRQQK